MTGTALALVPDPGRDVERRRTRVGATRPGLPAAPNPWQAAVSTWSQTLGQHSPAYAEGMLKHLGWFAGDHPDTDPRDVSTGMVGEWLTRQQWSTGTRRAVVVSLRRFYSWTVRAGLLERSPLAGVAVTPLRKPGPSRRVQPPAWLTPTGDFLDALRAGGRTDQTIRTREDHLLRFSADHADPWRVTPGDLARWLSREDWSPATKRAYRSTLRGFYSWAQRRGHVVTSPARDLDPVRQRRALPRPAPDAVVTAALSAADPRIGLALTLALFAGLRRAEIAGLHTRDIGQDSLRVLGKGGHERLVPIHPDLRTLLDSELANRRAAKPRPAGWPGQGPLPADGWLFPSSHRPEHHVTPRWLGTLLSRSLQPGWTAHTLRHRFATQAYHATRDLRAVQELLGHSKPDTTARYAAVPDSALNAAVHGVSLPVAAEGP